MSIHRTAIVDPKADVDPSAEVGPYCVIDGNVKIASGCRLYHNVFVTGWTQIEPDCELHPGVIVGHAPQDIKYKGERTYCRIGARTLLREYATVHRGTMPESETVVGPDCFLLGGSHVGHNCRLGSGVTLINNVLLAGHVEVHEGATLGGAAAVHQFVRIGERSMVGGNARVSMDVPPFALVDVDGRVVGLNRVGMRRAGMAHADLVELRAAYRILYGSNLPFQAAINRVALQANGDAVKKLVAFLRGPSRRGITGAARGTKGPEQAES